MARSGPETKLVAKMRAAGDAKYGERIETIKQHGGAFSQAGVSDLLICLDGVFVATEVKAPDNYGNNVERAIEKGPTVKQVAFIERIKRAGGVGGVVASVEGYMDLLAEAEKKAAKRNKKGKKS